jgi:purine-binding chemotaxis protein CheW
MEDEMLPMTVHGRETEAEIAAMDEERIKLVIFTLLDKYYSFFGSDVKEILPYSPITYVPGTPDFISGIINVRGDIEAVLDIHTYMGFPGVSINTNNRIIIAEKDGIRSGILMDAVNDVIDIPIGEIHPTLSTLDENIRGFVAGETTYKDRMVILLDIGKIFRKMVS